MQKALFAAMLAVGIGATAGPALAWGERSRVVEPNFAPAGSYDGTPQELHARIAIRRFAALAMTWITTQNETQVADPSDG
ncbi:MAG TPA: hypothetical protein VGH36_10185 [Acetobacteraceae bacterium]